MMIVIEPVVPVRRPLKNARSPPGETRAKEIGVPAGRGRRACRHGERSVSRIAKRWTVPPKKNPFGGQAILRRQVSWLAGHRRAFGLPSCPVALLERWLAAHSCGNSRAAPGCAGASAFPINPRGEPSCL